MNNLKRKHKAFGKEFLKPDPEKLVRIPWNNQSNTWWSDTCADIMEVFGLPGDRYSSHPTPNYMDFHFKSKKDADLCKIMVSHQL